MRARFCALKGTAKIRGGFPYVLPSPPHWGMERASFGLPLPRPDGSRGWLHSGQILQATGGLWSRACGCAEGSWLSWAMRHKLRPSDSHSKVGGWQAQHLPAGIHPWWQKCQEAEHCMRELKFVMATICILLILIKWLFSAYFLWDTSEVGLLLFWVFLEKALI